MQHYKQGPGPEFSKKEWLDKKYELGFDFPNLPYLIDGDIKMTESLNIYIYLVKKYVPELLGKNEAEKLKVIEAMCALKEIKDWINFPCYFHDKAQALDAVKNQAQKIENVEKKLGSKDWLIGDSVSVVDLMLMEVTDHIQMITDGTWLKDHHTLEAHNARTKELPGIKEYKASDRFSEGPFMNPAATVNNLPDDYWN